jgi:hypothetical protein
MNTKVITFKPIVFNVGKDSVYSKVKERLTLVGVHE